jgi:V8-like Glu-specific endopeptidase
MKRIDIEIALFVVLIFASVPCRADKKTLKQERASRVSIGGRFKSVKLRLYPVKDTVGEIAAGVVRATSGSGQVKALRLHFEFNAETLNEKGQAGTWHVVVTRPAGGNSWTFDSRSDLEAGDFWSPEMKGDVVEVQVFSDITNSALKLTSSETIEYLDPAQERSIVGEDDSIDITQTTNASYRTWARSVAKLTFITDDDEEPAWCTGFLIAADLFITNEHCPRSRKERRLSIVEFDFDSDTAPTKIFKLKAELVRNEDLDFAIYRLNKPVTDRAFLKLKDDDQNLPGEKPLLVIQHPAGLPKKLASLHCRVKVSATVEIDPPTDFGHECDTQGGSSGSPVQDIEGMVVGLHHYGFLSTAKPDEQINQAVKMGGILKSIKKKNEPLYKSLTNSR